MSPGLMVNYTDLFRSHELSECHADLCAEQILIDGRIHAEHAIDRNN